jgi:hypothetical protein
MTFDWTHNWCNQHSGYNVSGGFDASTKAILTPLGGACVGEDRWLALDGASLRTGRTSPTFNEVKCQGRTASSSISPIPAGAARCEAEAEIIERSFNVLSGFDEADGQR